MYHEETATFQKPRYGSEYMSSLMAALLCKVLTLVWNRRKRYRGGLMSSRWLSSTWLGLPAVGVSARPKVRLAWPRKQSFSFIKPAIHIVFYVQSFSPRSPLHLCDLNRYFYCPF